MCMQTRKTKKCILLSVLLGLMLCLFGANTVQAQGFYWGPRAGLNISSVTKTTYSKARARASFGMMMGYKFNDLIAFQTEAQYSLQGSKETNSDVVTSYNYIKVPVLLKLYLVGGLNVEAGVSFNWLVSAKKEWSKGGIDQSKDLKTDSKTFDLAIPVGLNYQFSRLIDIGARYDISTIRIPNDKNNHAKSSNWSISLGVRF